MLCVKHSEQDECHLALSMTGKKQKTGKRGAKRQQPPARLHKPTPVIEPRRVTTMWYGTYGNLTEAAAGAGASYTFAFNNIFDPDFTSTGLQPVGFDQMSAFYGRFRVIACTFHVDFSNITGSVNPVVVGFYASAQSTLPAAPNAWYLQPYGKNTLLGGIGSGHDTVSMSMKIPIFDVFSVTKSEYMDEADFAATTGGGPARQGYVHGYVYSITAASTVRWRPRLEYTVEWTQPVALSLS